MRNIIDIKKDYINIYNTYIKRDGAKELLEYLEKSDFFSAPASTQFHSNYEGGLAEHSINVYKRFLRFVKEEYGEKYSEKISDESIAICGLLHDLCKVDTFLFPFFNNTCVAFPVKDVNTTSSSSQSSAAIINFISVLFPLPAYPEITVYLL